MLRILTFGGMSVAHPERELTGAVLQPRRLALLAVLSRAGERGISRERLLALFWPDDEEERARKALTQAVYALRRDLGNDGTIVGTQELRLDAELIASDVGEFAQHVKRGRFADAIALYTGPFLQGFHLVGAPAFERWADDERTTLAHDYARLRERLAIAAEGASQMHEAVEHWRVLASVDPLNANVALRYMRALDATGDRAGALAHARIYEALISQELELPPDRAVVELAAELRKAPPVARTSAPANSTSANAIGVVDVSRVNSVVEVSRVNIQQETAEQNRIEAPNTESENIAAVFDGASGAATAITPTPPFVERRANDKRISHTPSTVATAEFRMYSNAAATVATTAKSKRVGTLNTLFAVAAGVALLAAAGFAISRKTAATNISQLHVIDTKRVTFEETLELDPAISPDGRMVAYAAGVEGSMLLYVRQLDGGNPVLISGAAGNDHRRPRWSPDGSRILFQSDRAIWIVPSLGGSARVVVDAPGDTTKSAVYPAWSPDGKTIAWVQDGAIVSRELEGKSPRVVTQIKDAHSLTWSPDGKFIAAATDNEGFVYGAYGPMRFAGHSIGNIAPGVIYLVNTATGKQTRLTDIDHLSTSPEWLKDSRTVVYVSNQDGARDLYAASIDANGERVGNPVRLSTGLDAHTVSVSSDGVSIAYTTFRQSANLWAMNVNSGAVESVKKAEELTHGQQVIEAMDVSPDGKWIAYDSDRGGQQDIFRERADGVGEPERLITNPTDDFHPSWSPDGRMIAFYRIRDGVRRGVVVNANGGNEQFVGAAGGTLEEHSPVWTPDGKQLLFHRFAGDNPDLYSIARKSDNTWSAPVRVTEHGGIWPTFSSDGREFAYFSTAGEISVMPLNGAESARRVVVAKGANGLTAMYARWIPGKRSLMIRAANAKGDESLWEVPIDGGAWRVLLNFDDSRHEPMRSEFATDGRRVYFTLSDRSADVFAGRLAFR